MNTDFLSVTLYLLQGFMETLKIFAVTLAASMPLGLVISFGSMSSLLPLKWLVKFVVWVVRGTPLMLQLIIVYYGPGLLTEGAFMFDAATATFITFILNYACYFSEIYRGGIESIPKGQYEACQVLGLTKSQAFFKVILLQVVKRVVPPMSNEIITLVKDTSLARTITFYEIIFYAQSYIRGEGIIWPLIYTGAFYLVFSGILTLILGKLEKKLSYFNA